ncbi:hypothetical protein M8J76_016393 [Diaphorina citri]|nr:hypothetical protein M8J76_016393 [Diaphorina citri]
MDTLITLMDIIPAVMEEGFQEVGEKVGETGNPLDGGDEGVSCKGEGWSECWRWEMIVLGRLERRQVMEKRTCEDSGDEGVSCKGERGAVVDRE